MVFQMIKYTTGNLLEDDAEVLLKTVNTVGVMGKGCISAIVEFTIVLFFLLLEPLLPQKTYLQ